ncbi:ATP-dependent DNA helicase RecG [Treponema sp.]|uniref:ATP-dependent DNA helicase RecG n=1 Tax=Treponema sp. TaxID=166 RepID=UPI0025D7D53C|nr:ATP-dependent DNA helicase RecG [Treponema sp.]MCR5218572.1 ATP-dependent DNA helicase RecG [Treponema sp.]
MKLGEIKNTVESLSGVGPAAAKQFARLGIFTIADILQVYPRDYEDRTRKVSLCEFALYPKVHTICKVTAHEWFGYGAMRNLKIEITDGTAKAWLIAFNRPFLQKSLPEGSIISVTGKFDIRYNQIQSSTFEAERIAAEGDLADYKNTPVPDSTVLPVYPLTEGLSQKNYRKAVAQAVKQYAMAVDDELPEKTIKDRGLLKKSQAIYKIHLPATLKDAEEARKTLIYEELYNFEYKMALRALNHRGKLPEEDISTALDNNAAAFFSTPDSIESIKENFIKSLSPLQKDLYNRLTFELTSDQMKVITEMNRDIDQSAGDRNSILNDPDKLTGHPFSMQRLLQGDVGSGKTLTAFFVCVRVINYGGQCAFLAPTELLARQHAENAASLLEPLGIKVAFLTGNLKAKNRNSLLQALKEGQINLVIGTHALFSKNVEYKNLHLAVIDEQHRFGVAQRESIVDKGRISSGTKTHTPDLLMMSATPIPQTLALTVFGDLDISVIKTMPQGRKAVKTYLTVMGHEKNVYEEVRKELKMGHQAYFVYPRINEEEGQELDNSGSQDSGLKSAAEMYKFLSEKVYPEYKAALIHGKIEDTEQKEILDDFKNGKIQILIATTVVEVGVDVANASCIVIEHADRFGLAELHQLRGRVGRSSIQSYCFLIYGKNISQDGIQRMKALHESTDGFKIAEEDLKLRGPGQVTGTIQSGYLTLGIADLNRDKEILKIARYDALSNIRAEL